MRSIIKIALSGIFLASVIVSCDKEYESIEAIDDRNVKEYIQKNNLNMTEDDFGYHYQVVEPGKGSPLDYSEEVPVILSIKSLDGKYSSVDTFGYENRVFRHLGYIGPEAVRLALKEHLKNKNGTIRLILPSRLAFGRNGSGDIPGNASLDMTVKALDKDKIAQYEDIVITKYLAANSLNGFTRSATGFYYKIDQPGNGSAITVDSTIVAEYTGKFLSGKVFDRSTSAGITFSLAGTIEGWRQAIPLLKEGGSMRLIVPSSLGYGINGEPQRAVPAFSPLDFTVRIIEVK